MSGAGQRDHRVLPARHLALSSTIEGSPRCAGERSPSFGVVWPSAKSLPPLTILNLQTISSISAPRETRLNSKSERTAPFERVWWLMCVVTAVAVHSNYVPLAQGLGLIVVPIVIGLIVGLCVLGIRHAQQKPRWDWFRFLNFAVCVMAIVIAGQALIRPMLHLRDLAGRGQPDLRQPTALPASATATIAAPPASPAGSWQCLNLRTGVRGRYWFEPDGAVRQEDGFTDPYLRWTGTHAGVPAEQTKYIRFDSTGAIAYVPNGASSDECRR